MTFETLKEKVAEAIDRNDHWDVLKLTYNWIGADEVVIEHIERWEAKHRNTGHLTTEVRLERDSMFRGLSLDIGEEAMEELRL